MKTIGTIFCLLVLPFLTVAQTYLDKTIADADLVFKGQVISGAAITNSAFPAWGKPRATDFNVISVLKGNIQTNVVTFLHITGEPMAWSGRETPSDHFFGTNQTYIVFAKGLDKTDYLFPAQPDVTNHPNVFRQLYGGGVMHTLDVRPLANLPVKEALWLELNFLLNDSNRTNQLDALEILGSTSRFTWGRDVWRFGNDFERQRVLTALLPLTTNQSEEVAVQALGRFAASTNATIELQPFTNALITVANKSPSSKCRLAAIGALSGIDGEAVSSSLSLLLKDTDENVRAGAVGLLPRFPETFAVQALSERVDDESANVRATVADVIGNEKYERALPILVKLFADPVGKNPLIKPMTMDYLKAGQRWSNGGDVHTSAGLALVKFAPEQVSDILKSNLDDEGFHINFVAKLAQGDPEPWLPELVRILETRKTNVEAVLKSPPNDPKRYSAPGINDRILVGTYTACWEDIRQYLMKRSPTELANKKDSLYLDLLENTVRPYPDCEACSVPEAERLYQLFKDKELSRRASHLRDQFKSDRWWFDDYDQRIKGQS